MKKILCIILTMICLVSVTSCSVKKKKEFTELSFLAYTDINTVCDNDDTAKKGVELLTELDNKQELLLSIVIDSEIVITKDKLGEYDHLIVVNKAWIENFDSMDNISKMNMEDLSPEMKKFFDDQMSMFIKKGVKTGYILASYSGKGLFSLPPYVSFGKMEPIVAKKPLLLIVDKSTDILEAKPFLLPLTSSGNVLFTNYDSVNELIKKYSFGDYANVSHVEYKNSNNK